MREVYARSSPGSAPRAVAGKRRALGQHFLRDPGIARAIVDLVAPTRATSSWRSAPAKAPSPGAGPARRPRHRARGRPRADRAAAAPVSSGRGAASGRARVGLRRAGRARPAAACSSSVTCPTAWASRSSPRCRRRARAIDEMALMLQREVAERWRRRPAARCTAPLGADPGGCDVGWPSACRPRPSGRRRRSTRPSSGSRPRAESRVPAELEARFREVVRAAFGRRRKTLAQRAERGPRHTAGAGARGHHEVWGRPRPARRNPVDRRVCRADGSAIMKAMSRRGVLLILLGLVTLAGTWLGVFTPPRSPSVRDGAPARTFLIPGNAAVVHRAGGGRARPTVKTSTVTLRRGDTLLVALGRGGLDRRASTGIADALRANGADLRRSSPGTSWRSPGRSRAIRSPCDGSPARGSASRRWPPTRGGRSDARRRSPTSASRR